MEILINEVKNKREINEFVKFPHHLYADDPNYVPELNIAIKDQLNPKKNPFFEHSEVALFLARRDKKVVGRIAAIRNNNYNNYHQSNVGFFGFFDVIDDYQVAALLLQTAFDWNKKHGFDRLLGPTNFSTNESAGILINGFDSPPKIHMTYNKPYYIELLSRYGFEKEMDLLAYNLDMDHISERSVKLANVIKKRLESQDIVFRNIRMKQFKEEVKELKSIYIKAWEKNWGFVPPTSNEFDYLANDLKMIIDPRFCYIAETKGEMIGFALALPDINQILVKIRNGKLFPTGIFKLLFGIKKTNSGRILLLGVVEEYRKKGIEAVFYASLIVDAKKHGKVNNEASWILENNDMMVKAAESLNGKQYKTYRIYGIDIK